jgi:uncharacterized protein
MNIPQTPQPVTITALFNRLLEGLPEFEIREACLGLYWTAVVIETPTGLRCGLASTQQAPPGMHGELVLDEAGRLESLPGRQVAAWVLDESPLRRSLGMAALNAALGPAPGPYLDENAADLIARLGNGQPVALIGHFPFADALRSQVGTLWVLEKDPQPGDVPAERAPEILPRAGVVAITGMTLVNHSLPEILAHCRPQASVLLLGPTTPLSRRLAEFGVTHVGGAIVEKIEPVVRGVRQGATFRQLHRLGTRLVTLDLTRPLETRPQDPS